MIRSAAVQGSNGQDYGERIGSTALAMEHKSNTMDSEHLGTTEISGEVREGIYLGRYSEKEDHRHISSREL